MDDFMLDFELLRQMEEEAAKKSEPEGAREESTSPYQNASQEAFGQLASMFQDIDELLQLLDEEEEARRQVEADEAP